MMEHLTVKKIREGLLQKEFSARELADHFLETIAGKDADLHAFLTVTPDLARAQAARVDGQIARGERIPSLAGVPCAIKDAILVEGVRCTAGSRMLEHYIAPYNATVTEKITNEGALIVGKTNMDEFGMGASNENSAFGPVRNPRDLSRVAGGSSGGSAASVGSDEAIIALGEDTGGSIRLPASFCGVVGLKPSYGAVSRSGIISLASSLDQVGPFGKTVEDAEALFRAISGRDLKDETSVEYSYRPKEYALNGLRIGVPKEYFGKGLEAPVEKVIRHSLDLMERQGAILKEITLPHVPYALAAYYIINTSEASSNLARYDGIRYGLSSAHDPVAGSSDPLFDGYASNRADGFGPEVKRRVMLGTYALSAGYYEAYYLKAQKVRALLADDFRRAFESVDVIAGPVSPILPFLIGERTKDPLAMYLVDVYTVPANLTGVCALSVPAGMAENLPVGLHLIAQPFREDLLFSVGKTFENIRGIMP